MKIASQSNPFNNSEPLRVPILEVYPEELHPMHPAKKVEIFSQAKIQQLHQEKGVFKKIGIGEIKADTPKPQPHVIPEVGKRQKMISECK